MRTLRYLAEAGALFVLMRAFAILPLDWASNLGGYAGRTLGPRLGISRRALKNLREAMPHNDSEQNRRILDGMWDNLGRAIAEYPHLDKICAAESNRVEIVNGNAIGDIVAAHRQALFFGGHFANWEVGPSVVHRLMGPSLLSVYRATNNPWVDRLMRSRLQSRHAVPKGAEGGRDVLRHLRRGGCVAMLVDQKMNDGVAVSFFGRDAMTAPAIARLSLRFDCPIVPVRVERLNGARFRVTVLPPIAAAGEPDTAENVLKRLTCVTQFIETWIRARPEQWLWIHRRWSE